MRIFTAFSTALLLFLTSVVEAKTKVSRISPPDGSVVVRGNGTQDGEFGYLHIQGRVENGC